MSIQLCTP